MKMVKVKCGKQKENAKKSVLKDTFSLYPWKVSTETRVNKKWKMKENFH